MNKYLLFFFLCFTIYVLAQNNTTIRYDLFNEATTFNHSDTILGVPFITNHNFTFLLNNSIEEFSEFNKSDLILDFSDFIENNKSLSFNFFSENNLLYFGFPKSKSYYSFGYKFYSYFDLNLSNDFLNLFWNGNNQFGDNIAYFRNNTTSLIQYSSLFFQYSSNIFQKFRFGARISLLHGINYFNLDKGNFSLQSFANSPTPYSSLIQTDIFYQASRANLFGFSNPGLNVNLGIKYILNKFKFSADIYNFGFIFWHKRPSQHQSEESYSFDGIDYTMDQVFSDEIDTTIDTLQNIFALNRLSSNSFFSKTPMRIKFNTIYHFNSSTDFFINYHAIQSAGSSYSHHTFIGMYKSIGKNTDFSMAYNINNFSFYNFQFAINRKFKNYLVNINTNNLFSIFNLSGSNYFNLQAGIYYFF